MATNDTKIREYIMVKNEVNHPSLKETREFEWSGDLRYTDEVYKMLKEVFLMDKLTTEASYVVALDHAKKPKGVCKIGQGNPNETMTSMENVFTFLLLTGAYSFILAHNHVSEMPEVSISDQIVSTKASTIANMFNMEFIGHMIIHPNGYVIDGGVMNGTEMDKEDDVLPYEILPNGKAVTYVFGQKIEAEIDVIKNILGV